jgi:site-specific DNA recombinase
LPPNAAFYARVSSAEQVDGFSIDAQLESLKEHCRLHNIPISKCYVEEGKSAKSIKGRPALQQLLADAQQGQFQVVLVWKISRLARNLNDLLQILEHFNKYNVGFQSLTEDIQTDSTMGQFMVQVMGAAAELERGQICDNVKMGIQERNRKGHWNSGNMVLGYHWHGTPQQGHSQLEVISKEAQLVQHIFQMYEEGLGLKAITNQLNASGLKTKKGLTFCIASVRGILTNPNYIGKIRIGTSKKRIQAVVEVQCMDGEQEPIITMEQWTEVQSRLQLQSRPPIKKIERQYPLTGILKCPQCGSGMTAYHSSKRRKNGSSRTNFYYICSQYMNKGITACKQNAIRADDIEKWFYEQIQGLVSRPQLLKQIVQSVNDKRNVDQKPLEKDQRDLEKELASIDKRQDRCFEMFEQGHIDQDVLMQRLNELRDQQSELRHSLTETTSKLADSNRSLVNFKPIQTAMKQIQKVLLTASIEDQKSLYRSLIDKITVPTDRDITKAAVQFNSQLHQLQIPNHEGGTEWETNDKLA